MADFETHPRGTAEEIRLSRKLSAAISELQTTWGDRIVPIEIARAQEALVECYMQQMKREQQ
jgi:hypothetical protein